MNRILSLATIYLISAFATPEAVAQALYDFNLPQQALADSLRAIGRQTATSILFEPATVENVTAPAVHGQLSASDAVVRVLAGTKLTAEQTAANTLLVHPLQRPRKTLSLSTIGQDSETALTSKDSGRPTRLAQSGTDSIAISKKPP